LGDEMTTTTHEATYQSWDDRSEPTFYDEGALIELLADNVLFLAGDYDPVYRNCTLCVNCNDLFYWGTADAEDLPRSELEKLYQAWKKDPQHGSSIWCCFQRGLRPQVPIVKKWRELGIWTDALEALPAPAPA
jgi:hypothetical protein